MRASILIIADFPNWAYHEMQQFLNRNLSDNYDLYVDFLVFNSIKKSKNPIKRLKLFNEKLKYQKIRKDNKYDIVLYFAFYFPEQIKITWKANKVIKGIYTDGFPPMNSNFSGNMEDFLRRFYLDTDVMICGSQLITNRYNKFFPKVYYMTTVKQKNLFKRHIIKTINNKKKFIIGWTGNPNRAFKGFHSHVEPAVRKSMEKYPDIELKTRFSGPKETLPAFYEDVDLVINASDADAGPSLFGEACMMEIPCISTDVGRPHEVIINGINGFIVKREIDEIVNRVITLYENRNLLFRMSQRIKDDYYLIFDNDKLSNNWKELFNNLLES